MRGSGWLAAIVVVSFVLVPLGALVAGLQPGDLIAAATDRAVIASIGLSVTAAAVTAAIAAAAAVPLAFLLARTDFPGKTAVQAIVDLPLAVPHTVAGIALLFAFGRTGVLGGPLEHAFGLRFWGTVAGIVVAMLYVSLPYTVSASRLAFEAIDPPLEHVARTLHAGPWTVFTRISLPLARPGILSGMTLTFARAISEFGAVVILAYFPMTAPVKIYDLFLQGGLRASAAAAIVLLAVVLVLVALLRGLAARSVPR